jgi:Phage integrase family
VAPVFFRRYSPGLTPASFNVLLHSLKPQTRRQYAAAWERWCTYCDIHADIDRLRPTVAEFINYLTVLSEQIGNSTVENHKSAVFHFLAEDTSRTIETSRQFQLYMKGLRNLKPRVQAAPAWEIDRLLRFMEDYAIPLHKLYPLSRHLAMLMLLFSGRRVHDLSLLHVGNNAINFANDQVSLQPRFGSKTDRFNKLQSPMLFSSGEKQMLDVPALLRIYLDLTQPLRGSCLSLFLSPQDPTQPASIQKLRSWIKSLLAECGINAPPGSTRSAVATAGILDGMTVEAVMERGNWTSAKTLFRHYLRFREGF